MGRLGKLVVGGFRRHFSSLGVVLVPKLVLIIIVLGGELFHVCLLLSTLFLNKLIHHIFGDFVMRGRVRFFFLLVVLLKLAWKSSLT